MRKLILGISLSILVVASLVLYSTHAFADDDRPHGREDRDNHNKGLFNPDRQLSKSACGENLKDPIINITQKVQNDADSGEAGNYWAFDYYTRHIKVWQTTTGENEGPNTYCAIVTYDGKFYAVPGQVGPGNRPVGALINTSTNAPVNGDMSGGRRATIVGTLLPSPAWPTNGNVGIFNYQCNISGVCPGVISWPGQYFNSGFSYNDDWWGWRYDGGSHGTWINAITGNSGNIL